MNDFLHPNLTASTARVLAEMVIPLAISAADLSYGGPAPQSGHLMINGFRWDVTVQMTLPER